MLEDDEEKEEDDEIYSSKSNSCDNEKGDFDFTLVMLEFECLDSDFHFRVQTIQLLDFCWYLVNVIETPTFCC